VLHIVGSHATRLIGSGQATSGMGQWSFLKLLGKNNKRLIIASIYCVHAQTAHIGSNTIITQQTQILLRSGQHRPKPCDQLISNLIDQIHQWQHMGHKILMCLDANEDTTNPNPEIGYGKLLHSTSLIDLHQYRHPQQQTPATHNQGSLTIDACIGTQLFTDALIGSWILPFGLPETIQGDHRMLGLDFDQDILFGNKIPLPQTSPRHGVYSNDMLAVREFNDRVAEECDAAKLFACTQTLYHKYRVTNEDHDELENIDQILTKILVATDQKCQKFHNAPWSPNLHRIYLMHCCWKI